MFLHAVFFIFLALYIKITFLLMDSPQSVLSPLKKASPEQESENPGNDNHTKQSLETELKENESTHHQQDSTGALEVHIDRARDIHNICIYQKQDVYAKLSLTSDPEETVSTKTVNGGGRNPVFDETLRLSVPRVDSSLKCEIWMLSRVRNYLEDQLLGFALVPVSEILLHDGKLEREFSLSSTDLFHSPAGFVQLSVTYLGKPPEVIPVTQVMSAVTDQQLLSENAGSVESSPCCDLEKIEFPDPLHVVKENQCMVEEYFAMPCSIAESDNSSESFFTSNDTEEENKGYDSSPKIDSPPECCSEAAKDSKPLDDGHVSQDPTKANGSSNGGVKPVVAVGFEPAEPKVVQQDIVEMYMKSMQQFTESLAKMKLPLDIGPTGPAGSDGSISDLKSDGSNKNSGSRVFYGSRAFY